MKKSNVYVIKVTGNLEACKRYARACAKKQFPNRQYEFIARPITKNSYHIFVKVIDAKHTQEHLRQLMIAACDLVKNGNVLHAPEFGIKVEKRNTVYMVNDTRATKAEAKSAIKQFVIKSTK